MQRIFLIHGWGGSPGGDWFPWAKKALTDVGFDVITPKMPDTEHPKIVPWVKMLEKTVGKPEADDIFIGHSVGCQTILRYLENLNEGQKVKRVILIAPWWYLTLSESEAPEVAERWLNSFVDFSKIKQKANKFICVFSKNDPWVPYAINVKFFKKNLNPEVVSKDNLGHFTSDEGATKIEFLLDLVK